MCLCTTVFVKIRCYAELVFNTIEDEWLRIKTFSTPKILRFVEILEKFKPPDAKNSTSIRQECDGVAIKSDCDSKDDMNHAKNKENNVKKLLKDIESCDFNTLGDKIQDRVHIYESNLKDLSEIDEKSDTSTDSPKNLPNKIPDVLSDSKSDTNDKLETQPDGQQESLPDGQTQPGGQETMPSAKIGMDSKGNEFLFQQRGLLGFTRRAGNRLRGKSRMQRNNAARALQMQQNPDALCGIVFMKEPLIAKIMFMVIVVSVFLLIL